MSYKGLCKILVLFALAVLSVRISNRSGLIRKAWPLLSLVSAPAVRLGLDGSSTQGPTALNVATGCVSNVGRCHTYDLPTLCATSVTGKGKFKVHMTIVS